MSGSCLSPSLALYLNWKGRRRQTYLRDKSIWIHSWRRTTQNSLSSSPRLRNWHLILVHTVFQPKDWFVHIRFQIVATTFQRKGFSSFLIFVEMGLVWKPQYKIEKNALRIPSEMPKIKGTRGRIYGESITSNRESKSVTIIIYSRDVRRCKINGCRSCYNCFSGSCCRYWKRVQFFDPFRGVKSLIG